MTLLLSYYGDDFTGSTDVMESMSLFGFRTVLFTRRPDEVQRARFTGYDALGLAGTSRSQSPDWMDEHLPPVFEWLKSLGARFTQYKVCSTFDSSPATGSIGRAAEIARRVFGQKAIPLVVGAPQLKRYTAFGHLFAAYQGETYRIDRHPVMSRHPVTPMDESDIRLHLKRQTSVPVALVPTDLLSRQDRAAIDGVVTAAEGLILFDVLDLATQLETGRQLLRLQPALGSFVMGSSGVNYALVRALSDADAAPARQSFAPVEPVERTIVVSGSCSPTTARQIRHALGHGFDGIHADPLELASGGEAAVQRLAAEAIAILKQGRSVVVYTALDPEADKGAALDAMPGARHRVGSALGQIARRAIADAGLPRAVLAGGDTSSHALGELDVYALTTRFPLRMSPGSPLCRAWSGNPQLDGLEIAMKGGQVGGDDYFTALRDGTVI